MTKFGELETGDWFKSKDALIVKVDISDDSNALSVGPYFSLFFKDDELVEPVEVTITIV